jgi:hypothetical protein
VPYVLVEKPQRWQADHCGGGHAQAQRDPGGVAQQQCAAPSVANENAKEHHGEQDVGPDVPNSGEQDQVIGICLGRFVGRHG